MRVMFVCVLICLIVVPFNLNAQDDVSWQSGCSRGGRTVIAPLMGRGPYHAACEALNVCLADNPEAPAGCETPVYDSLMSQCEGDDCDLQSTFYMASLLMFERFPMSIYAYETRPLYANIGDTFQAFEAGDYQAVIDIYAELEAGREFSGFRSPFEDFIVGLMYEQLGDLETAVDFYYTSIDLYRTPYITIHGAQVLLELGYDDVASAEALTVANDPLAEMFLADHPLPEDNAESWVAYISNFVSVGEGGSYQADFTPLPGVPFQLVFLSDGSVLMNGATSTLFFFENEPVTDAILFYPDEDGNGYARDAVWIARETTLTFTDGMGEIYTRIDGVMDYHETNVLITPADAPDPRAGRGERCEDGARWRLTVDGLGAASQLYDGGTPYYDAPDGEQVGALDFDLYSFRVVDGPVCIGSQAWWEIDLQQDDGQTYWLPEAEASSPDEPRALRYLVGPTQ